MHHCAAGPRPGLDSRQLSAGCRVDGAFGGLCNEGVRCNKCKISLTLKTKLQAKRRQSSSARNLADSKERSRAERREGTLGQWQDRGQQTVWQALTDLKAGEAVAKSSGKSSGRGGKRGVAKNLSIARGKLSLALGFARFTGAAKRHEWGRGSRTEGGQRRVP